MSHVSQREVRYYLECIVSIVYWVNDEEGEDATDGNCDDDDDDDDDDYGCGDGGD